MRQGKVRALFESKKICLELGFAPTLLILKMCSSWGVNSAMTIECLPPSFSFFVAVMKYANVVGQLPKITYILDYIKSDYERLKGSPEYSVLYNCALEGRRFVLSFIDFIILLATIYFILPTVLIANDIVTKNKSEDKYMAYPVEYYFFDAQKHYYFSVAHFYSSSLMVLMFIVTFDSLYIVSIQHACALFTVTGYRLKTAHILDTNYLRENRSIEEYAIEEFSVEEHEKIHGRLVLCINEHRRALAFTSLVKSTYSETFFFQVSFNIICLSITGVQLTMLRSGNVTEMIRLAIWMMGQLFHLFFVCLPGQKLMDFGEQVYFDAMDCKWYLLQQRSRALYQFLIMNTSTPVTLTALKVTALNFQTFLSVTQTAVSYFTVLSSSL